MLVDGTFPDYRRVIPELPRPGDLKARPAVQSYRASYLADFGKIVAGGVATVRLLAWEHGGPAVVFVGGRDDFFGVLMPHRDEERERFPDWWTRKPKVLGLPAPETSAPGSQARETVAA